MEFSELNKMIDVNIPIIYIQNYDFVRVDEMLSSVLKNKRIIEWNPATGLTDFYTKEGNGNTTVDSLTSFLRSEYLIEYFDERPTEKYILLKEIQDYIDDPSVRTLLLLIAQRKLYDRCFDTSILIECSFCKIPKELEKYVSYLEPEYPSESEINRLIDEHVEVNGYVNSFKQEDRDKLLPSLKGMSLFEIDRMLDMAMSSNGTLTAEDKQMILKHKKQIVKKSGLIELVDTPESMDSIGGLEVLKSYLQRKAYIIHNLGEAEAAHVSIPKGIFIVGMPGCGKSLCAKATATLFETPLLKLDLGSMMGRYVGESEENLRRAIKIAEAAAPCVLWVDEIEKAFSGVGGHNDILTRMFGYFLSWLQDKKSAVYVIATANNADNLPPELKRKGRFDEIFCVDLPNDDERKLIFKVHLEKRGCTNINISKTLVDQTEGFNGADIESVVNASFEEAFINKKQVDASLLLKIAKETVCISMSCKKQINAMKKVFADENIKKASKL